MKQTDTPETTQDLPSILTKLQSGSLFTKSSLIKILSKPSNSRETSSSLEESPKLLNSFYQYFTKFYKHSRLNGSKHLITPAKITSLQHLFEKVIEKGGWSTMIGRDYWTQLSISVENPDSLKEDYAAYLFPIEKSYEYSISSFSSILSISPFLMKNAQFLRINDGCFTINDRNTEELLNKQVAVIPSASVLFDLQLDLWVGNWGEGANSLNVWPERSEEFSVKILNSLHWNGNDNLVRYTKPLLGLNLPEVINSEKCLHFVGKKTLNQLFFVLEGRQDWFGVKKTSLEGLMRTLKKEINLKEWVPDEQFLLENSVEFTFVKSFQGDLILAYDEFYWWAVGGGVIATWMVFPYFRLEFACISYLNDLSRSEVYNVPLIAVELLNRKIGEIPVKDFDLLKQVVNESIDEESWLGVYELEKEDHRNCVVCRKELFWRYSLCQDCLETSQPYCLKCSQGHECKNQVFLEKFPPCELDFFLYRLEKNEKSSIQRSLIKSNFSNSPNIICSVQVDCVKLKSHEEALLKNIKPVLQDLFSQSEELYRRKGLKKQKLSENHSNSSVCLSDNENCLDEGVQGLKKKQKKAQKVE